LKKLGQILIKYITIRKSRKIEEITKTA